MAAAVVVIVVGVVLGVMALLNSRRDVQSAAGSVATTEVSTSPPSTHPPTTSRPAPPSSKTPSSYAGNDVVAVEPAPAQHGLAPVVVDVLTAYFVSINNRDFVTYRSLFTSDIQADLDLDQLAEGFRSTHDQNVVLVEIDETDDGRLAAWVRFTSTQDAVDGVDGQTCTNWLIALYLQDEGGRAVIGTPPDDYHAQYEAC